MFTAVLCSAGALAYVHAYCGIAVAEILPDRHRFHAELPLRKAIAGAPTPANPETGPSRARFFLCASGNIVRCESPTSVISPKWINLRDIANSSRGKTVMVKDRMQRGYRYILTAPVGRNFDPGFRPELTPAEMLRLGVFGGKYMTDCAKEFPRSWFAARQACRKAPRSFAQLFRRRRQPAVVGLAPEGLDLSRRPARLVPVVLPLLYGPPHPRRGCPADQALEGHAPPRAPNSAPLRAGRRHLPASGNARRCCTGPTTAGRFDLAAAAAELVQPAYRRNAYFIK